MEEVSIKEVEEPKTRIKTETEGYGFVARGCLKVWPFAGLRE